MIMRIGPLGHDINDTSRIIMPEYPVTNPSLLLRLRNPADSAAWSTFAEVYETLIFAYCRKQGLQEADARDVTQDVLASVAKAIQKFDYDQSSGRFRSWLYSVIRSKLANHFKKSVKQPRGSGQTVVHQMLSEQPDSSDEQAFEQQAKQRILDWACERIRPEFEPATWEAFHMTAIQQIKPAQVAETLGVNVTAVYNAKSRVVKRLQQVIHEVSDWDN